MIFPSTVLSCLLLLVASLLCLSLWTTPLRLGFKWRYELFYYDVTWGVLIAGLLSAFTLGSLNSQELTFQDNLLLTGYRKIAWAIAAGGIYNLANLLLIASAIVGRMSLAFPTAFGIAIVGSTAVAAIQGDGGNLVLGIGGCVLILGAIITHFMAAMSAQDASESAAQLPPPADAPADAKPKRPKGPATKPILAVILGVLSGIFFACATPALWEAQNQENGIAAYGAMMLFSFGFFFTSAVYVPFLANFPVAGAPVPIRQYFKGAAKNHILGLLGGFLLFGGLLAQRVAAGAIAAAQPSARWTFLITGAVGPLGAIVGILIRDFRHSDGKGKGLAFCGIVLFLVGLALIGISHFDA